MTKRQNKILAITARMEYMEVVAKLRLTEHERNVLNNAFDTLYSVVDDLLNEKENEKK